MNPLGRNWATNVSSARKDTVSFMSPTVPCQVPTRVARNLASGMGGGGGEQEETLQAIIIHRVFFRRAWFPKALLLAITVRVQQLACHEEQLHPVRVTSIRLFWVLG